eukprot:TRINITY_DN9737_c0_g1_i5.p2 TRINITY_DN9737_c0_g1~~TRINITY_DN9737_c0_g1_i5.p2  ORF type:complete len:131 (+),score=30.67 TRINITY_DN9737_c0_g1_i5:66-458(+)
MCIRDRYMGQKSLIDCSEKMMRANFIDQQSINKCFNESFMLGDTILGRNTFLQEDKEVSKGRIHQVPIIEVNEFLHETMDEEDLMDFICESLEDPPQICLEVIKQFQEKKEKYRHIYICLLYTSPSPRDS